MAAATGETRVRRLPCGDGLGASLVYYPPGGQPRHAHGYAQISFLLAGEMLERHGRRDYALCRASRGLKPAGEPHENHWGGDGTLIFSVRLAEAEGEPGWAPLPDAATAVALIRACLAAAGPEERGEAVRDLIAVAPGDEPRLAAAPAWLRRARDALSEAVPVAAAAREAGVHRVHFSRLFHRAYGLPPSLYRQRQLVGRAIRKLVLGRTPMSEVAAASGFADQAHMIRSIAAATGLTPGALRRRFGEATSVQSPSPRMR